MQEVIRQFRQAAGALRALAAALPPQAQTREASSATSSARYDGTVRSDIVVAYSYEPPRGESTVVVSFVGENKAQPGGATEATARTALGQSLVQLASSFQAFGTALGACLVNGRYSRLLVMEEGLIAVEAPAPALAGAGTAREREVRDVSPRRASASASPAELFLKQRQLGVLAHQLVAGRPDSAAPYVEWIRRAVAQLSPYCVSQPAVRLPFYPWNARAPNDERTYGSRSDRDSEAAIAAARAGKEAAHFRAKYAPPPEEPGARARDGNGGGGGDDDDGSGGTGPAASVSPSPYADSSGGAECDGGDGHNAAHPAEDDVPFGAGAEEYAALQTLCAGLAGWHVITVAPAEIEQLAHTVCRPGPSAADALGAAGPAAGQAAGSVSAAAAAAGAGAARPAGPAVGDTLVSPPPPAPARASNVLPVSAVSPTGVQTPRAGATPGASPDRADGRGASTPTSTSTLEDGTSKLSWPSDSPWYVPGAPGS